MTNYTFTKTAITVNGKEFPAEYSITPNDTVFAFVTVQEDGKPVNLRIKISADDPRHGEAMEAAQAARKPGKQATVLKEYFTLRRPPMPGGIPSGAESVEDIEPRVIPGAGTAHGIARYARELTAQEISDYELYPIAQAKQDAQEAEQEPEQTEQDAPETEQEPAQVEQDAPETVEAETAQQEQPAQTERMKVEKPWIGLEIKGRGWKILFDGAYERTRVIFQRKPSKAAEDAVKAAGFYWSPVMQSWNKKLTCKAFRAAQGLSLQLKTICG